MKLQSNTTSVVTFLVLVVPLGDALPETKYWGGGAQHNMDGVLASLPSAPGSILGAPEIFRALLSQWTVAFERTHVVQSRGRQIQLGRTPS